MEAVSIVRARERLGLKKGGLVFKDSVSGTVRLRSLFLSLPTSHLALLPLGRRLEASLWVNLAWKSCLEHRGAAEGRRRTPGWKRGPLSNR